MNGFFIDIVLLGWLLQHKVVSDLKLNFSIAFCSSNNNCVRISVESRFQTLLLALYSRPITGEIVRDSITLNPCNDGESEKVYFYVTCQVKDVFGYKTWSSSKVLLITLESIMSEKDQNERRVLIS